MTERFFCPLCLFVLALDYDGHLLPCILRHATGIWFTPLRKVQLEPKADARRQV